MDNPKKEMSDIMNIIFAIMFVLMCIAVPIGIWYGERSQIKMTINTEDTFDSYFIYNVTVTQSGEKFSKSYLTEEKAGWYGKRPRTYSHPDIKNLSVYEANAFHLAAQTWREQDEQRKKRETNKTRREDIKKKLSASNYRKAS